MIRLDTADTLDGLVASGRFVSGGMVALVTEAQAGMEEVVDAMLG